MRTSAALILLAVLLPSPGRAEVYRDAGAAAYQFLKLEVSPRASALGGTVLLNSGAFGVLGSPAAPAALESGQFAATHAEYFGSTVQNCIGIVRLLGPIAVSGGISSVSTSGLELRDEASSEPEGTFSCWDIAVAGGAAFRSGIFDAGVSAKLIREKIWLDGSWGFTIDAGVTAHPAPWLETAAAVLNLGPSLHCTGYESFRTPLTLRSGARLTARIPYSGETSLTAEVFKPIDNEPEGSFGLESRPYGWLALRAGERLGSDSRGFSAGLGLETGGWGLDYAWVPGRYALGDIHRISLSRCL